MLIHSGGKSHKCDVCGKSFTQKCVLKEHQLTHILSVKGKEVKGSNVESEAGQCVADLGEYNSYTYLIVLLVIIPL